MNSLLVAWKPIMLVIAATLIGLWLTGHHGLTAFAGAGFFVLIIFLLTGNLGMSGLVTVLVATVIVLNFTGQLHYNQQRKYCQGGYHWDGAWQVLWAVGKLEFRLRQWHCDPGLEFDPGTYQTL